MNPPPGKKIHEVIDDEYFKQTDARFPKDFLLKYKPEYNISHFITVDSRKAIQKIGLEHGVFYNIVKIKRTMII